MDYLSVQCIFALRLKTLVQRWTIPILCFTLATARVTTIIIIMAFLKRQPATVFLPTHKGLIFSNLVVQVVMDFINGVSFCYCALKSEGDLSRLVEQSNNLK
jgi:hypothetical protein